MEGVSRQRSNAHGFLGQVSGSDDCTLRVWDSWDLRARRDPLQLIGHQV